MYIPQGHGTVFGVPGLFTYRNGSSLQNRVDPAQGIRNHHFIFTHVHYFRQRQRDHRRNDNVEQQIQQKFGRDALPGEQQTACNQKSEDAVDGCRVEHHGQAQLLGIGDDPFLVLIDGSLEFLEGKYRLPEGFHHRDTPDIFYGLIGHSCQSIAILAHFFCHPCPSHGCHNGKSQKYGHQAQ